MRNRAGSRKSIGGSRFISQVSFPSTPRVPLYSPLRLTAGFLQVWACVGAARGQSRPPGISGGWRVGTGRRRVAVATELGRQRGRAMGAEAAWPDSCGPLTGPMADDSKLRTLPCLSFLTRGITVAMMLPRRAGETQTVRTRPRLETPPRSSHMRCQLLTTKLCLWRRVSGALPFTPLRDMTSSRIRGALRNRPASPLPLRSGFPRP